MPKLSFSIILFFCVIFISQKALAQEQWNTSKSTHFIVYYKNAPSDFIDDLISKSEELYDRIAENLGFTRFNFWLWDKRAKIYIYDDAVSYQKATSQPAWSAGAAIPSLKVIHTFPYAKGFFDTVLPHEMGHIIFREFVGFDNPAVPLWLDEGVASFQEKQRYYSANSIVKNAITQGKFTSLENLGSVNPGNLLDQSAAQIYYAEAISIVDFLFKEYGRENFVVFCQYLRDKKNLERSMSLIYPFSNIKELGEAWQKYLK